MLVCFAFACPICFCWSPSRLVESSGGPPRMVKRALNKTQHIQGGLFSCWQGKFWAFSSCSTVYVGDTSAVNVSESQRTGMETLVTLSYSHPLTTTVQMKKLVSASYIFYIIHNVLILILCTSHLCVGNIKSVGGVHPMVH